MNKLVNDCGEPVNQIGPRSISFQGTEDRFLPGPIRRTFCQSIGFDLYRSLLLLN
jgi:hypothetical protein